MELDSAQLRAHGVLIDGDFPRRTVARASVVHSPNHREAGVVTATACHRQYVASRATTRAIERAERVQRVRQQSSRGEGAWIVSGKLAMRSGKRPSGGSTLAAKK